MPKWKGYQNLKRLLSIALTLSVLLLVSGCASTNPNEGAKANNTKAEEREEFEFQNGLKFGISKAEFQKFEEDLGATFPGGLVYFGREEKDDLLTAGDVPFANRKMEAYASFKDDALTSVIYAQSLFGSSSGDKEYYDNKAILQSKYGLPIAEGSEYRSYPWRGYTVIHLYETDVFYEIFCSNTNKYDFKLDDRAQFLIPVKGGYVTIFCMLVSTTTERGSSYRTYSDFYSYSFITEEDYNKKMEEITEKEQNKKNDL